MLYTCLLHLVYSGVGGDDAIAVLLVASKLAEENLDKQRVCLCLNK